MATNPFQFDSPKKLWLLSLFLYADGRLFLTAPVFR